MMISNQIAIAAAYTNKVDLLDVTWSAMSLNSKCSAASGVKLDRKNRPSVLAPIRIRT